MNEWINKETVTAAVHHVLFIILSYAESQKVIFF